MEEEREREPLGQSRRPFHVDEQQNSLFQPRCVIAAGDEIEQHVLTEQFIDLEHEGEDERRRKRKQNVLVTNPQFAWKRERPCPEGQSERDESAR